MTVKTTDVELLEQISELVEWKVELDMEGNFIVSPETDLHLLAAHGLWRPLDAAAPAHFLVMREGPPWSPLAERATTYIPDLAVVERSVLTRTTADYHLARAPILVVEILSRSSRRRDLNEKATAYYDGGAQAYWTLEVPALTRVGQVELTIRRRGTNGWDSTGPHTGLVEVDFPFPVKIDLTTLTPPA